MYVLNSESDFDLSFGALSFQSDSTFTVYRLLDLSELRLRLVK